MKIKLGQNEYPITIIRKKIKNMYLRTSSDGQLYITCGNRFSEKDIVDFVQSKQQWILQAIEKEKLKTNKTIEMFNKDQIYIFGTKYNIKCEISNKNSFHIEENNMIFKLKKIDEEFLKKKFYELSEDILMQAINKKIIKWENMLIENKKFIEISIKIKVLKGRWGFCVPNKKTITISKLLIHYPIECLDYVLLHEYAHLLQANHSKKFYDIIYTYMPDYKRYEMILRNGLGKQNEY